MSKTWQQQWVAGAQRQWSNVVSLNNHGISWQPFRITIGFDIMSSIPSEGPLNSNIYVLNGWITATSAPGGGKVRSVTAKFTLTLRSILCPYLDSQGIVKSWFKKNGGQQFCIFSIPYGLADFFLVNSTGSQFAPWGSRFFVRFGVYQGGAKLGLR